MLWYLIGKLFYRRHRSESPRPASAVHNRTLIFVDGYAEIGNRILNMIGLEKGTLLVNQVSLFLQSP